jgi:hypothetical protein
MRKLAMLSILMLAIGGSATSALGQDGAVVAPVADAASIPAAKINTGTDKADKADDTKKNPLPNIDANDPGTMLKFIVEAFKTGKWAWAVGLILMLIAWLVNTLLKSRIPKKVMPWVAIGLGVSSAVAMSFASGAVWYNAIGSGLSFGLIAIGGWEAIGKLFKKKAPPAEPKAEAETEADSSE